MISGLLRNQFFTTLIHVCKNTSADEHQFYVANVDNKPTGNTAGNTIFLLNTVLSARLLFPPRFKAPQPSSAPIRQQLQLITWVTLSSLRSLIIEQSASSLFY